LASTLTFVNRHILVSGVALLVVSGLHGSQEALAGHFPSQQSTKGRKQTLAPKANVGASLIPNSDAGWGKATVSAAKLAADTDLGLSYLKNSGCFAMVRFSGKDGKGSSQCQSIIKDASTFHVEFPMVYVEKIATGGTGPVVRKAWANANGTRLAVFSGGESKMESKPLGVAKLSPAVTPDQWTLLFPKIMFSALRSGHPFGDLVAAVSKPGSGFSVKVEEKSFYYEKQILHQRRLTIRKTDTHSKPFFISATIDVSRGLPVTIETTGNPPGRPAMTVLWRGQWGQVNPKKLTSNLFVVPKV